MKFIFTFLAIYLLPFSANAFEIQKVTDGVYALVGDITTPTPDNKGNNSTHGVIITAEGVVLVDPGAGWKGAEAIHAEIRKLTDKPVKFIIDSGGQDHRWMGNGYWKSQGAKIIASAAAVEDQKDRGSFEMTRLDAFIGKETEGTQFVYADIQFDKKYDFELGGVKFEIIHAGGGHTPGDSFVWLPQKSTVFTGDIVFAERILGVGEMSNSREWIDTFKAMAKLNATHVVPGHGHATNMAKAKADTLDYLLNLRTKMAAYMADGGDIINSVNVDQSKFSYLKNFKLLAKRNAQQVYSQMEFE